MKVKKLTNSHLLEIFRQSPLYMLTKEDLILHLQLNKFLIQVLGDSILVTSILQIQMKLVAAV